MSHFICHTILIQFLLLHVSLFIFSANPITSNEPGKYILGGKYDNAILPMDESQQTLQDASIEIADGQTIMTFTKMLKEENEIKIAPGLNTFLWAHGSDTESTYHGVNKGAFQLNLLGV